MALVLSRYRDERAIIDLRKHGLGVVKVLIVDIRWDKVRLGFEAQEDIPIHREEVWDAIERQAEERK